MNHLPFKDWLLSEDPLTSEQVEALQGHLRSCDTCRRLESAWTDVNAIFEKAPLAEPIPGFTSRWQDRLALHHLRKQRKLAWIIVGIFTGITIILLTLFGAQLLEVIQSPGNLILVSISRLTGILSLYWAIESIFNTLTSHMPSISWLVFIFGIGFISFLSVLWLAAYRKLTLSRRFA